MKGKQAMNRFRMASITATMTIVLSVSAAGAVAQPIPVQKADDSRVRNPPRPLEPDVKGYGIRAVEGGTLDDMLTACKAPAVSSSAVRSAAERARCDQLLRTLKTQPGGRL